MKCTTNDTRSTTFSSLCRAALAAVLAAGLMIPTAGLAAYADEPDGGGSSQAAKALTQGAGGILEGMTAAAVQSEEPAPREAAAAEVGIASSGELPSSETQATPLSSADPTPRAGEVTLGGLVISGGTNGGDEPDFQLVGNTVQVLTSTPLTIRNSNAKDGVPAAAQNTNIQINAGVNATITLAGVSIASSSASPINMVTNSMDTESGAKATEGSQVRKKTTLHLILADGSVNTLNALSVANSPGLRCGEGSVLVVDDSRLNIDSDGNPVVPVQGRVGFDGTLIDGTPVKATSILTVMDADNPGSLICYGGDRSSGIGGGAYENAGTMTFEGGVITGCGYQHTTQADSISRTGAGIGGGINGSGTDMFFNGGRIVAYGAYHAAGIGAGYGNQSYVTGGAAYGDAIARPRNSISATLGGNITINGGFIQSNGGSHGNAFGSGCVSNNVGKIIKVTGGTLLPSSVSGRADIGGDGGYVIITGGSVRLSGTGKFQGLGGTAYNTSNVDSWSDVTSLPGSALPSTDKVFMITVDLKTSQEALTSEQLESFKLYIGGEEADYGAPSEFSDGKLYLWLPEWVAEKDAEKEVRIEMSVRKDGEILDIDPLYIAKPSTSDTTQTVKRYIEFDFPEDYQSTLEKDYDGIAFSRLDLTEHPITVTRQVGNSTITETLDAGGDVKFKYQLMKQNDDGEWVTDGLESAESETSLPKDSGQFTITMTSYQYANHPDYASSYWGHQAKGIAKINPVPAVLHMNGVEWGYLNEETGEWKIITQDQVDAGEAGNRLKLSFNVRSANTTALTCEAPTGSFQIKIDGKPVGDPIPLTKEDVEGSPYSSLSYEDVSVESVNGGTETRHATVVTYYLDPQNRDALLDLLENADGAEHTVNIEYIADKNYIQGVDKNPENAKEDEAFIVPVPPKGEVEPDGPVKIEDPDPVDPDPDNPTGKMTVIRKTITANYSDFHKKDAEIADFFAMAVSSNSSAPTTYDVSNGAVADIVWDDEEDAPALTDDGKLQIQVSSCGSSVITLEQKANALYTGIKYILTVNVLPDASLVPQVQIRMISNNLTHPGQPARPGDEIEYLVSGLNLTEGSAWQAATLLDTLDGRLELDRDSVRLASNYATPDRDTTLGTPAFYKDFDWDALDWENLPIGQYTENGQQVSKMVGSVYGGQSTTLRFTATLKAGTAGRPTSPDDPADIKNEPGGEGGYGTPEDSIVPGQEPDVDPTPLPEENIVIVGDDPKTDDPDDPDNPDDDKKQPDDPGTVTPLPIIPKDPVVVPDPDDPTSSPDITVTKTAENLTHPDAKRAVVGDEIEYTVVVENSGADSAWYDAVIRDTLPAGLEPVSNSFKLVDGTGASIKVSDEVYVAKTRTIALYVGDLYGGERATLTFRCTVTPEAAGGSIGNVAFAFGDTPSEKWEKEHPTDPDGPADPDDPDNPGTEPGDKPGEGDDNPGGTPTPKPKPNPGDPFVPEVPDGTDDPWEDFDWDNYPENKPQPSNQDKPAAPNDPDKGVLPGDPVEESLAIDLVGENLTRNIADTMVGDHIRYTLTFTNTQAHTSLMLSALRNQVPDGLALVPGSITVTVPEPAQPFAAARAALPLTAAAPIALAAEAYADDATVTYPVNDASYDEGTRTMAVNAGELAGGKSVVLVFEAVVGPRAAGKTIVDNGWGHGTVPTYYADDDNDPAISTTFVPAGGLAAYMAQPGTRTLAAEHVIPVKDVIDPEDGAITVKKEAENLTTRGGDTYVGDRIRYTVTLGNATPGSAWYDAVISDVVPKGIDVDTAKVELKLADGKVIPVKDAYDAETRRLAVNVGDVAGGTAVQLIFEAVVTEEAVDADVGNVAVAYGTLPSESDPKRFDAGTVLPEPGTGFSPEEGWEAFEENHAGVTSGNPVYPSANVTAQGGVKPAENGFGTRLAQTGLAQTGDAVMGIALLMTLAAVVSLLMVVLASRCREERE